MSKTTWLKDASEIADYIVSYFSHIATNEVEGGLTNLKLQKLLYYVQVFSLKKYNKPAFSNQIEAWDYGPVVPDIYQKYKEFGKNVLDTTNPNFTLEPAELKNVVDSVIEEKGQYTGYALMKMTHNEKAWKEVYVPLSYGNIITNKHIQSSFDSV